mmetsp:Transcript_12244/g.18543  ORF Transcript_12244/g.18543 Transcript_12244/m.18543 type:complete len:191 (+) Transcript_12244:67-639(+)
MDSGGRGNAETLRLKANIEDQLNRLLQQLQDLEDNREDFDDDEYEESRQDTIQQMKEFEQSLMKMKEGNMTLVDEIGSVQLAIQQAIRSAFKSPEVIKMFAKKENGALRSRLAAIQADHKLGRLPDNEYRLLSSEILSALDKLGEPLDPLEKSMLEDFTRNTSMYSEATQEIDSSVISTAATAANQARKK